MGWNALFPPLQPAWAPLGPLKAELLERTGLPARCRVICGIHDSNASLLRHLAAIDGAPQPAVLSTGTWVSVGPLRARVIERLVAARRAG